MSRENDILLKAKPEYVLLMKIIKEATDDIRTQTAFEGDAVQFFNSRWFDEIADELGLSEEFRRRVRAYGETGVAA